MSTCKHLKAVYQCSSVYRKTLNKKWLSPVTLSYPCISSHFSCLYAHSYIIHISLIYSSVIHSSSKYLQAAYTSNIYWVYTIFLALYSYTRKRYIYYLLLNLFLEDVLIFFFFHISDAPITGPVSASLFFNVCSLFYFMPLPEYI